MARLTWEQAVQWLRDQPEHEPFVVACYYDDPLIDAARRFANSDEWLAVRRLLPHRLGRALDLGAGRGIASFALAQDGWQVTALEPDPSDLVGAGAIRALAAESRIPITVVEEWGESLPFPDQTFDLVYGRQVFHHARDLTTFCQEIARVLKPGGQLVATREHVISRPEDLEAFLNGHPLHHLYGGKSAYPLGIYSTAMMQSGLHIKKIAGPFDSVINYFPMTHAEWRTLCLMPLTHRVGSRLANRLTDERHFAGRWLLARLAASASRRLQTPGRLFSFVAERPL